MVTEYKDGFNLEQCLALYGPPSHDVAVKIMHSVCETIMYAQKQGFLHRAIKPGNIIFYDDMNAEPTVFLTDFSLSKDGSSVDLTDLRDALYMTSDEARNLEYSEKSEIYGIGCIGYSLLTGRAPFTDNVSALELKNLHALKLPPRISDIKFDTTRPRDLDELVERCLEKDPSYRFDSISQLADRLQVFPRREQLQAAGALAAKRTKKIMIIAAAIGVPLIICLMLFLAFGTHH
ncbi:MAG: protein kinase [Candidatus Obscuribacterales bacterium]|nr:protein kinase [Candidatus Obscuribacterales bacterium]